MTAYHMTRDRVLQALFDLGARPGGLPKSNAQITHASGLRVRQVEGCLYRNSMPGPFRDPPPLVESTRPGYWRLTARGLRLVEQLEVT